MYTVVFKPTGQVLAVSLVDEPRSDGDIAVLVVMDPEGAAVGHVLAHEVEACDLRVVGVLIRSAEYLKQRECSGRLVGGADVEQA